MKHLKFFTILLLFVPLVLVSCSDDDDDDSPVEFIAEDADFDNYNSWTMVDYTTGPRATLQSAHGGSDDAFARAIYASNSANSDGNYPVETRFVKETFKWENGQKIFADMGPVTAMAKRGGEFDSQHGDWEYFLLEVANANISARGADLMDGGCRGCHAGATGANGSDFIFNHPDEVDADPATDFADFENWELWVEETGPDAFLGEAHGINDDFTRKIYRKQTGMEPLADEFPAGTVILKELIDPETGDRPAVAGQVTAMVKRGGDFNTANNGWEWFMMDANGNFARGGAEMGCNGCHVAATGGDGTDYVFSH